ncbi:response regulator [Sabulicella rubraurantiaca]|uniref:response regulator n=1 Tax=Sabulicella rubraurantiaca TaxID=2811429 RepID=UPI001A95AFA7|nr:response regulator [Sabulicella rubraurantiaca]
MTTILVVDDEPLIAMALEAELADAGYQVVTAANGRQGLDRLAETPKPDLVLSDMMMPIMGGAELVAAMEADPKLRGTPVIIVSSLPEAAVQMRVNSVAAILRKPYTAAQILNAVARVLGNSK